MSQAKFLINKHSHMRNDNVRVFFPVGMGGFSFERMDETTVVYDCGSYKSTKVIKVNIEALKNEFFGSKDLVIDHPVHFAF